MKTMTATIAANWLCGMASSGEVWIEGAGRCSRQAQINVHNFAKLSTGAAAMAAASASAPIKAIAPFG